MSHFTVAVITAEEPTKELLEKVMQPFHEFECTGIKDQYVVPVDETEEKQKSYQEDTVDAVFKDGVFLGSRYEDKFRSFWKRESEYSISSGDEFILPKDEGYEVKETPVKDVWSFEQYLKDWEGYSLDGKYSELTPDGKFLSYTNPNKTWDWWVIGGRWSNSLLTKSGEKVDSCMIGELDFDARIAELKEKANERYDQFEMLAGVVPREWQTWKEVRESNPDASHEEWQNIYHSQPFIVLFNENNKKLNGESYFHPFGASVDDFHCSREEYVEQHSDTPFQCYNMLIAAEANAEHMGWYGGEMGWFGMGNQQKDWDKTYQDLLRSQPKDHYITVIDCHI